MVPCDVIQSCVCAAACHPVADAGPERFWQDAARSHSGEEARPVSHPVSRVPAGAGDGQDEETCRVGTRGGTDGRRTRLAARRTVSLYLGRSLHSAIFTSV